MSQNQPKIDETKELSNKEKKALKKQQKAAKKAERLGGVTQNNIPADILERQRLAQEKKLQNKQKQQQKQQQQKQQQEAESQENQQQNEKKEETKQQNQTQNQNQQKNEMKETKQNQNQQQKKEMKEIKEMKDIKEMKQNEQPKEQKLTQIEMIIGKAKPKPTIPIKSSVHSSFLQYALESSEYKCIGSTVRSLRLIESIIKLLKTIPQGSKSEQEILQMIKENLAIVEQSRKITIGMENIIGYIYSATTVENKIETAMKIANTIVNAHIKITKNVTETYKYIDDNSTILTCNYSSLLLTIFKEAFKTNKTFKVIVVETSPFKEGGYFARELSDIGIDTTYILPSGLQTIISSVDKMILSASGMDGKGSLYTRSGTASIVLSAQSKHIPVIVCCETYKMTEKIFIKHENEVCRIGQNVTLYDEIPHNFITVVVNEYSRFPPLAIPAVVREQSWKFLEDGSLN